MRRSQRLAELKRLLNRFPELPGFLPNIRFVGERDPAEVARTQNPLEEWANDVRLVMPEGKNRIKFDRYVDAFKTGYAAEGRASLIPLFQGVINQEIHDIEDEEPHWTTTPTFWVAFAGMVFSLLAAVIAYLAWQHPIAPPDSAPSMPAIIRTPEAQPPMPHPSTSPVHAPLVLPVATPSPTTSKPSPSVFHVH